MSSRQNNSSSIVWLVVYVLLAFYAFNRINNKKSDEALPEDVTNSIYDVKVDIDDNIKSSVMQLMQKRTADVDGWRVELANESALVFKKDSITIVGGVTVTKTSGVLPMSVTVKSVEVDGDCLLVNFNTGLVRVKLL